MKLVLFSLLVLAACTPARNVDSDRSGGSVSSPSIAFITMQLTRTPDGSHATVLDQQIKPGTFKSPLTAPAIVNYLTINSYEAGKLAYSTRIEHPLFKEVEYTDSSNTMRMRSIELPEAQFFFRVQMHSEHSLVKVLETLGDEAARDISQIELTVK